MKDIEIIDSTRDDFSYNDMLKLMRWTNGEEGELITKLWSALNQKHFDNVLKPLPLWFPSLFPYNKTAGRFTANLEGQSLSIQIKAGMTLQDKSDVLLHEMIHQYLSESDLNPNHNALPWCNQIMRLSKDIWDKTIWASPSVPRKVNGISKRIQKPSSEGSPSIPLADIASWPHSIDLHLPIKDYSL